MYRAGVSRTLRPSREDAVVHDSATIGLLSLAPPRVVARYPRAGRFQLHLDNRNGTAPQRVTLHGCDPERRVRFAFRPRTLDVRAGDVGFAAVRVRAPGPSRAPIETHLITVVADDGSTTVEATATFVRSTGQSRRVWRALLTLLGALAVAVGGFRPWLDDDGSGLLLTVPHLVAGLDGLIQKIELRALPDLAGLVIDLQPLERLMVVVTASSIALGLLDRSGQRTRDMSLLVLVVVGSTALLYLLVRGHLVDGIFLVLLGGVVGLLGGMCVRR